jgi:PPK2 family polyphosphate:nucleotide phosphotransferase
MLYAGSRAGDTRSLLLVLQGMDTAGKGGIVKHVVGAGNPQGIRYASFGKPTEEELAHHYLWRIRKALPPAGHIGVFDRSHYEDVLIVRVHNLVPPDVWEARYDEINAFEKELVDSGTKIVKVAMFVSLDEQKRRLAERLDRPDKFWKYNPGDIDERLLWPQYQEAYQAMLDRTSTDYAPWHIVPCNRKWYSRLAILELLIEALKEFDLSWPPADFDVEAEKRRLASA